METNSSITLASLEQFEARFDAQRANRVAMNAVTENGLTKSAKRREAAQRDAHTFSVSLNQGTSPTRSRAAGAGCSLP